MSTDGTTGPTTNGPETPAPADRPVDPAQVYSLRQAIWQGVAAFVIITAGLFGLWWVSNRLEKQSTRVDALRKDMDANQTRTHRDFEQLRLSQGEAAAAIGPINNALEEMQQSLRELAQFRNSLEEELQLVRQRASQQQSLAARSEARRIAVLHEVEEIRAQLGALVEANAIWQSNYAPLESNDSGRRIASMDETMALAATRWQRDRTNEKQLASWRDQLTALEAPLKNAQTDDGTLSLVDEQHLAEIRNLGRMVAKELDDCRDDQTVLDTLQERTKDRPPGATTLGERVRQLSTEAAIARTTTMEEARQQQTETDNQRLADLEKQRIALVADISAQDTKNELAKLADDLEGKRLQGEIDEAKRRALKARQALLREYQNDLPEIRSLLMPFISHGYAQPATGWEFKKTLTKGPVSLAALHSSGLLDDDRRALNQLYFATTANRKNDRPLGSFPAQAIGARDGERAILKVQRARELLIKYGELLVADELLAK
jgi:hypothetical protein